MSAASGSRSRSRTRPTRERGDRRAGRDRPTSRPTCDGQIVRAPMRRRSGVHRRGGAPLDDAGVGDRRHRPAPADARRRLHRAHRPRGRGASAAEPRRRGGARMSALALTVSRHAGARHAATCADPAPARPADRLHDPAGHVRAAVRLRLRRRDPDAGLRLRRLPDAGHHRPVDRLRRVRHRARARGGRQEGPHRPLPVAADVARRRARRADALRHRRSTACRSSCCSRSASSPASTSSTRASRDRRRASSLLLLLGYAFSWIFALIGLFSSSPETANAIGFTADLPADVRLVDLRARSSRCPTACASSRRPTRSRRSRTPCAPCGSARPANSDVWMAFVWCIVLIAVFAPLAVPRYRRVSAR